MTILANIYDFHGCYYYCCCFLANSDGISWSEWTEWSDCKETAGLGMVRVRSRNCTLRSGSYLYSTIPCLLIPQSRGNIETLPCRHYRRATPLPIILTTGVPSSSSSTIIEIINNTLQPHTVTASDTTLTPLSTAAINTDTVPLISTSVLPGTTTPRTMTTTLGSITSTPSSIPIVDYGVTEIMNVTEEISNSIAALNLINLTLPAEDPTKSSKFHFIEMSQ